MEKITGIIENKKARKILSPGFHYLEWIDIKE